MSRTILLSSLFMGSYGVYRGYNVETNNTLLTDKIISSLFNGIFYTAPIVNFIYIKKFLNRIEIEHRGWNKHDYENEYTEFNGINFNTF